MCLGFFVIPKLTNNLFKSLSRKLDPFLLHIRAFRAGRLNAVVDGTNCVLYGAFNTIQ